jgi:hypothetical protein
MKILLNRFEDSIEPSILKKGLSYFKNNKVVDFEEISIGQFEATVEGTENYKVTLEIDHGMIVEKICTCPYDVGPVCKHIAAVLFYMQQDILNIQPKAKPSNLEILKSKSSAKTAFEKFEETLNKISYEDLKKYVMDYAQKDTGFRKHFMTWFKPPKTNNSKEFYIRQIQSILRKGKRQYGFIDRSNSCFVASETRKFIDLAEEFIKTENWIVAFNILTAIIESLLGIYNDSDDSYGAMGGCVDIAFLSLWNIARSEISEDFRKMFLNYCSENYQSKNFSEWSYDMDLIGIAVDLLISEQEGEYLLKLTNEVKKSDYNFEKIQKNQFDIIYKSQGEDNAILFLENNLDNNILLEEALKFAVEKKDYEKAKKYANKGIKNNAYDKWNRKVLIWYMHLLNIAEIQNDTENIIKYATYLMRNSNDRTENYLSILKSNIAPQDWDSFINQLISEISNIETESNENLLFAIFTSEERWADLLTVTQKTNSLRSLEKYEKILSPLYPEEMSVKYAEWIQQYLKDHVGREHYQLICRCIRRVKKWGSKEIVNTLVEKLRLQYKMRSALIEELNHL